MGSVVDATYAVVSAMLSVPPVSTDPTSPLYQAWSTMRNLANVAFVIAFLIVIYSQITGAGVSNYGVKKLLPRIIAAAILVNVSYWLCAILVDVSNLFGASIKNLFDGLITGKMVPNSNWWDNSTAVGVTWTAGIAAGLAIGTSAIFGTLAVLLPMLIAAVFAALTVVLVLTARQALIILFIVVSPLAFIAFLLPNTQKLYKKWQSAFVAMLVMFPAIAALFGASKLASVIVMQSSNNTVVQIMGAGISIVPLILSPIIMKMSTGSLGMVAGLINKGTRKASTAIQKPVKEFADTRAKLNRANRVLNAEQHGTGWRSLAYRRNQRERARKDRLATAETDTEEVYSRSAQGQQLGAARVNSASRSKTATTNINAFAEETRSDHDKEAEDRANDRLKIAQDETKAFTEAGKQIGDRIALELAAQHAKQAEAMNKQELAEVLADRTILTGQEAADAMELRQSSLDTKVAEGAAASAKRVEDQQFNELVSGDSARSEAIATAMGGVDRFGATRAKAVGHEALVRSANEAIASYQSGMSGDSNDELRNKMENAASMEERAAAAGMVAKNGGSGDVIKAFDDLGRMMAQATTPEERSIVSTLQKEFMGSVGSKLPLSMRGQTKGEMTNGKFSGSMNDEVLQSLESGRYSGANLASASKSELEAIVAAISSVKPYQRTKSQIDQLNILKDSMTKYENIADSRGHGLSNEIKQRFEMIHNL